MGAIADSLPAGWWKFDLALSSGSAISSVTDSSGNGKTASGGNNLTYYGPGVSPTGLGGAYFNSARISVPGLSSSPSTQTYAFVVWMDPNGSGSRTLIGGTGDPSLHIYVNAANKIELTRQNTAAIATGNAVLPTPSNGGDLAVNRWSVVLVEFVSATSYRIEVNGVADVSGSTAVAISGGSSTVYIGEANAGGFPFRGYMGEVVRWDRVLTSTERSTVQTELRTKWIAAPIASSAKLRLGAGVPDAVLKLGSAAVNKVYHGASLVYSAPTYSAFVLADSPNGYWRMGESGSTVTDLSGNGRNGSLSGTYGRQLSGLTPDADGSALLVAATTDVTAVNSNFLTLECLVKTGLHNGSPMGRDDISANRIFQIQMGGGAPIFIFWTSTSGPHFVTSPYRLSPSGTHLVACTYDGTTARVFADGIELASLAVSGVMKSSALPLTIGGRAGGAQYHNGLLDEVAQYPTAQTLAQHQAHATAAAVTGHLYRTSSEVNADNDSPRIFDGFLGTQWLAATSTGWVEIRFPAAKTITQYTVRGQNNTPTFQATAWTFQGWDGTAWVTLDTVTGKTWASPTDAHTVTLASPGSYTMYRVNVTANAGGAYVGFSEFSWRTDSPLPAAWVAHSLTGKTYFASSSYDGTYPVSAAFDRSAVAGTAWATVGDGFPAHVGVDAGSDITVKRYRVSPRQDVSWATQTPTNWELQGGPTPSGPWTTLDAQAAILWRSQAPLTFELPAAVTYRCYRLANILFVNQSGGVRYCAISELTLEYPTY